MVAATLPSRTQAGVEYQTTLRDDGTASCTCKAGQFGRACWHVAALRQEAERRRAWLVVALANGRTISAHPTMEAAKEAAAAITRRGGWVGVYRRDA